MKCEGITFPKNNPYIIIGDYIKKIGMERFGHIKVGNKIYWAVEDPYTITRYENRQCAEKHFRNNIKINKQIKKAR
mgnify:FL=1